MKKFLLIVLINTFISNFIFSTEIEKNEHNRLKLLFDQTYKLSQQKKFIQAEQYVESSNDFIDLTPMEQIKYNNLVSKIYFNASLEYLELGCNNKNEEAFIKVMECIKKSFRFVLDIRNHRKAHEIYNCAINNLFKLGVMYFNNGNIEKANSCLNSIFFEKHRLSKEREQELSNLLQKINESLKEKYH